jgi:hypothetical protein
MITSYVWINIDPIPISETRARTVDVLKGRENDRGGNVGLRSDELSQKERFSQK